jgi:hypothetical protein
MQSRLPRRVELFWVIIRVCSQDFQGEWSCSGLSYGYAVKTSKASGVVLRVMVIRVCSQDFQGEWSCSAGYDHTGMQSRLPRRVGLFCGLSYGHAAKTSKASGVVLRVIIRVCSQDFQGEWSCSAGYHTGMQSRLRRRVELFCGLSYGHAAKTSKASGVVLRVIIRVCSQDFEGEWSCSAGYGHTRAKHSVNKKPRSLANAWKGSRWLSVVSEASPPASGNATHHLWGERRATAFGIFQIKSN